MDVKELHEASMNFDLENVEAFLMRLRPRVEGLSERDVKQLASEIAELQPDDEKEWSFTVSYDGKRVPLKVRAFMDDVDAPDLAFFTTEPLSKSIEAEMDAFGEALGI